MRVDFRFAKGPYQGGLSDQEVVHEELAAEVDGDDLRGMGEIGHGERLAGAFGHVARGPGLREGDAVVECFVCHGPDLRERWTAVASGVDDVNWPGISRN